MKKELGVFSSSVLLIVTGVIAGCTTTTYTPIPVIAPTSAVLMPGQALQFTATEFGSPIANPVWLVNQVSGGSAAAGRITASGLYTAPANSAVTSVQVTASDPTHKTQSTPAQVSIFQSNNFQPGVVSPSINPLVAVYTLAAPMGATVRVQFGTTTSYGLTTWTQPAPGTGGNVGILVAGMRASTTYHMQASISLPNGTTMLDTDKVFTTGDIPANILPNLTVQQTSGLTPTPGVELLCLFEEASQTQLTAVVTDLQGNVIWYYPIQPSPPFPMKLLPNGHMLVLAGATGNPNQVNAVQEIDLTGGALYQLTLAELQQELNTAGFSLPQLTSMDHDVVKLANGHLILIATDQSGAVTGNALIDWDPEKGPMWTWSAFDHISLTHAPMGTTDWTHANAVVYSPDDGNLILSMRNQDWIVKINYADGSGDGRILWRLGPGGDFTLPNGQSPIEWNYGQHYPVILSPNSAGIFSLMFFNNGNGRLVDQNNDVCGTSGFTPCYSSVPVFQLNEYTNTAEVLQETNLSPAFSTCCGSTSVLSNGDLEYDIAADVNTPKESHIKEVTQEQNPQLVWHMTVTGQLAYRGFRIPSLYPGVEWTQSAMATANAGLTAQYFQKSEAKNK